MSDSVSFTTGSGKPIEELMILIEGFTRPSQSDRRLAGEIIRTGIRERSARGVDATGAPFNPYNETHPYYYSPNQHNASAKGRFGEPIRRFTAKSDRSAVTRLMKKLRGAGEKSGSGRSIKFASYGAFKRAFGRANVDLLGVSGGDHMLDAIQVTPTEDGVRVGIYETRAVAIGTAHNSGLGRMPVRAFFGIGDDDIRNIEATLAESIRDRIRSRR